ncbi:hypothetical protein ACTXI9_02310 [Brachybacterium alimentarium]|uniref:hypothetical protein n=1 Tax=Brachybacterium alimentarium TaxID=47845 RepID=UPI003FB9E6D0
MTSTTMRPRGSAPHGSSSPGDDLAAAPALLSSAGPRRRPARFPGPSAAPPTTADGPLLVRWAGADEGLRELVRDHAGALGMELSESPSEGTAVCLVVEAAALEHQERAVRTGRLPLLVVTASPEVPQEVWERALAVGARAVVPLPAGSDGFLSHLAEFSRPRAASRILGVVGGCGGAGTSSFAARLAAAARTHGSTVLIDADPLGGGLDLLIEAPEAAGIGWADVSGLGPDDGEALHDGLPAVDDVRLLAATNHVGPAPEPLARVLTALRPLGSTVVVDLADGLVPDCAEHLDQLLLVVPASDHAVRATARRLRSWQLPDAIAQVVVRRRGPLTPAEVSQDLGLPLAASFRDGPAAAVPLLDVRRRGADRSARRLMAHLHQEQAA